MNTQRWNSVQKFNCVKYGLDYLRQENCNLF